MKAGDTFFLGKSAVDRHLWIIISDPVIDVDRVLFLSMTTHDITKEDVCLIGPGEHPFVKHPTCINYEDIREATLNDLVRLQGSGDIRMADPVSPELLIRIRDGISLSLDVDFKYIQYMIDRGLIS
jgi:hypothetical protein